MRFQSSLAVLLTSLVVFASCANDDDDDNGRPILAVHGEIRRLKHHEGKTNSSDGVTEKRSKRSLSYTERNTVLSNFNYQRGLVGASDMNYLDYSTALEVSLSIWTMSCNFDADVYSYYKGDALVAAYRVYPDHAKVIQTAFSDNETSTFNSVRSIYVEAVAGSVYYCPILTVDGKTYYGGYLLAYGLLTYSNLYNHDMQQYTPGPACTRCQSNVAWCYNNLCRADCSSSISGCRQISNGVQTTVRAGQNGANAGQNGAGAGQNGARAGQNGANGIQAIWTAILNGLLLIICYSFQ